MPSLAQLRSELQSLSTKALDVSNDTRASTAQKRSALDLIEAQVKTIADQIADETHLNEQRKRFGGGLALSDLNGASGPDAVLGSKAFGIVRKDVGQAPPISFTPAQMEQAFEALQSSKSLVLEVETKAPSSTTTSPMAAIPDYRLPPIPLLFEPARVLNLLPGSPTNAGSVQYFQVSSMIVAAAAVAEGAVKPESSIVYAPLTANIRKLAHFLTVTDEALSDYSHFLAVIQNELLAGLISVENDQLLNGTGVAPNIGGLLTATGILAQARGTDTRNDALMKAITAIRNGAAYADATAIVMHPTDYQATVLEKDTQGRYIAGDPRNIPTHELWGVPVTVTTQIATGTALVGAFPAGAEALIRWGVRLEVNGFSETEWKSNKQLVRCEERLGLAITRPAAFCKVSGL